MRHAGRLHKIYWDACHPDPIVFPLQDAWFTTADEYNQRIQPPSCEVQLQTLKSHILFYFEDELPSILRQLEQAISDYNDAFLSPAVLITFDALPQQCAEVLELSCLIVQHFPALTVSSFSKKESASLHLSLSRILRTLRRHLTHLDGLCKTCYRIDQKQKYDTFYTIVDGAYQHVLMLIAKTKVAREKLPYRWIYHEERELGDIEHFPKAEWNLIFQQDDTDTEKVSEVSSPSFENAPIAMNIGPGSYTPSEVRPFEKEAHLEADAYADEVCRIAKRNMGIPPDQPARGFFHMFESAKQQYLKRYYDIRWLTSEERNPGWIFD